MQPISTGLTVDKDLPELDGRPPLKDRLAETRRALERLQARLRDRCPGVHEYVQHCDLKPPWCDACGYTDSGLHKRELLAQG